MKAPRAILIRAGLLGLLGLLVLGLGSLGFALLRPPAAERVLILRSSLDSQGKEVGPGLETLLSDYMEILAGATVTHGKDLPSIPELQQLPPGLRLLRFQGRRDKDLLALSLEWNTVSRLLAAQPWVSDVTPAREPAKTMDHVVQHWPLITQVRRLNELLPRSSDNFWLLLEALSIQDDLAAANHLPRSWHLVEEEPTCATAWAALGDHLYRSLWVNPEEAGVGLNSRTHHAFRKAVDLVPGYPRATFLWSLMLTDTGNQSPALRLLKEAIRMRPGSADLYLGVAYASRTSGLLEGARRALVRRNDLLGHLASPSAWFAETTYLYLGDQSAFGQELLRVRSLRKDASTYFYQGYFALLQGQRRQALGFMTAGSDPAMGPTPFRDLCRVYLAYLEGRVSEGLQILHEVDEVRGKLRIPDGEWTFKEAEAYALLGDADHGIDCATRAFVQGFSCAEWYEASPFLARVRTHPRWPTLRRNVRERQAELAGSFPPASFDP
jgi:tetratricopeptide (TPR) repeat protein